MRRSALINEDRALKNIQKRAGLGGKKRVKTSYLVLSWLGCSLCPRPMSHATGRNFQISFHVMRYLYALSFLNDEESEEPLEKLVRMLKEISVFSSEALTLGSLQKFRISITSRPCSPVEAVQRGFRGTARYPAKFMDESGFMTLAKISLSYQTIYTIINIS